MVVFVTVPIRSQSVPAILGWLPVTVSDKAVQLILKFVNSDLLVPHLVHLYGALHPGLAAALLLLVPVLVGVQGAEEQGLLLLDEVVGGIAKESAVTATPAKTKAQASS
ncbi:hypothetical protein E2562_028903 [Oryza meyeriana var. granulata]|uniref:Uncharacterized protein n=1 Tax=Oryza meyeriana var. granulata TaxID=110450 RepID=A0A6G1FDB6_9ORYZ|nr:hypothetical protein E2562_028903 [Oryza meyeriana var. granulata]